jgi:hypothetical protein
MNSVIPFAPVAKEVTMKIRNIRILVCAAIIIIAGISQAEDTVPAFPKSARIDEFLKSERLKLTVKSEDALVNGYILVVAQGKGRTQAQARTAAHAVAVGMVANILADLPVAENTLLKTVQRDYSDTISVTISGHIRGVQRLETDFNAEEKIAYELARLGISASGQLIAALHGELAAQPDTRKALFGQRLLYTLPAGIPPVESDGLIVEVGGTGFKPAVVNRIFVSTGELVFDPCAGDKNAIVETTPPLFSGSLEAARGILEKRGLLNLLTVKAEALSNGSDLTVTSDDAAKILAGETAMKMLTRRNVVYVLGVETAGKQGDEAK